MRNRFTYGPRERRATWKQDTPDEQFVAVMQSVEGWVGLLKEGISPKERCLDHIEKGLEELKALQAYMQTSWEGSDGTPEADPEHPRKPEP